MPNRASFLAASLLAGLVAVGLTRAAEPQKTTTDLRFEVTVGKDLVPEARDGRLLLVLGRDDGSEPRKSIGDTGLKVPPLLGVDVPALGANSKVVVDQKAAIFPIASLAKLPAGEYRAQAVFHSNRDL